MTRFDFCGVLRRISTWLATTSAMTGAAAAAFVVLPGQWQSTFPAWAGQALAIIAVVSAGLVPLATSFRQKGLEKP